MGRRLNSLIDVQGRVVSVHATHALGRTMVELTDDGHTLRALVAPDRGESAVQSGNHPTYLLIALGRVLDRGPVADLIARGEAPSLSVVDGGRRD